ncbi:hypothetical protein QOT17_010451 [Balamuthia mandrillaris]
MAHCKTKGCYFYPNPGCKGYCSSCAKKQLPKLQERKARQRAQRVTIQQSPNGWSLELPPEVWFNMLSSHAHPIAVGQLLLVCRDLYHLCSSFDMWKAIWQREAPEEWKKLIKRGEDELRRTKKDLMKHFVKTKVFRCVSCDKCKVLPQLEKECDVLHCDICRKEVCGRCVANCHYCGEAVCEKCGTTCELCGEAMHCHADDWTSCPGCGADICMTCNSSGNSTCGECSAEEEKDNEEDEEEADEDEETGAEEEEREEEEAEEVKAQERPTKRKRF